jgi:hypothetical protein
MNRRPRKAVVGLMLALSLLGLGAVAQPAGATAHRVSADRWCC